MSPIGKRLILLRHGNTFESDQTPVQVGARTDMPLTKQGLKQAVDFALYLKREKILPKAIFAGSLKRQTEAANLIGVELNIVDRVHLDEAALTEIDYGLWEGLTSEEIHEKWPLEYETWNERGEWGKGIFGGSLETHMEGISTWLKMLYETYSSSDTVVALTSQGVIRFFSSFVEGKDPFMSIKVKTGHFCDLLLCQDKVQLMSWNVKP